MDYQNFWDTYHNMIRIMLLVMGVVTMVNTMTMPLLPISVPGMNALVAGLLQQALG